MNGCEGASVPMTPLALVQLCRKRVRWYERVHPELPAIMRTVILPVHLSEDADGSLHFTIASRCDNHSVLAELPLGYVMRFALDVATGGKGH